MKRAIVIVGLMTLGLTAAMAQTDIIQQRQGLMKQFGAQTRTVAGMMRGQAPFDLAQTQAALKTISQNAQALPPLFPEATRSAENTEALPTIWQSKGDFDKIFVSLDTAARAAMEKITDEASFKAEMPKVLQNCGTCHKTYRQS